MSPSFIKPLLTSLVVAATLAGCAASDSANMYSRGQVRQAQSVRYGVVESVQQVKIQGESNALYTIGGAALGGLAGNQLGQGTGSIAGAIAGALAGGAATNALQDKFSGKNGLEITVKLDGGGNKRISIVQDADVPITVGQRVRVLTGGGADRVVPQ